MAQYQGPRAQMVRLFWSSPVFGTKILQKSQSARGPTQCKSAQAITWFVGITISIVYFSITIHLHLASFYATKYF